MDKKNFESELEKIEKIKNRIDSSEVTLDEAMILFKDGLNSINYCNKILDEAKQSIEIIEKEE